MCLAIYYKMLVHDAVLLRIYFKFGNFLGVTSCMLKSDTRGRRLIFNVYIIILFVLFAVASMLSYKGRLYTSYKSMVPTQKVTDFLQIFTEFVFMTSTFLGAIVFKKSWKSLLDNISVIDNKLKTEIPTVSITYCFKGVLYFLAVFLVETYDTFAWEHIGKGIEIYYVIYRIVKFYQLFTLLLISEVVKLLIRRYHYLNALVKSTFALDNNVTYMRANLKETRTLYILLNKMSQEISKIFGKNIMFILAISTIMVLSQWNWIFLFLTEDKISKRKSIVISVLVNYFSYIVSTVNDKYFIISLTFIDRTGTVIFIDYKFLLFQIIMSATVLNCDKLEETGQDIVRTCYVLQEYDDVEQSIRRKELVLLSKFFRKLAPKISACGYFSVNKNVLSGLFSAVTSYAIIITQFRQ